MSKNDTKFDRSDLKASKVTNGGSLNSRVSAWMEMCGEIILKRRGNFQDFDR